MIRRRRPRREIEFSFDSFLEVVASVVGIVLRLVMVAWLAGRGSKAALPPAPPPPRQLAEPAALPDPSDPRDDLLAAARERLGAQRHAADRRESERVERSVEADALAKKLEDATREREALLARHAEARAGAETKHASA